MSGARRDTVVAVLLLAFCAGAYWATFDIQTRNDGVMHATVWPRAILACMAALGVLYLVRSLRGIGTPDAVSDARGVVALLTYYRNPIGCFVLYFAFLATLPYLGMLIGGVLLTFLILCLLGGFEPRRLMFHAAIAVIAIGGMWAVFTFALRVILPSGEILPLIFRM
jgi:putative tricarboxylic transport membrane protein